MPPKDSPALSDEAFHDALAKGLGRTMLALREPGGPQRYGEALVAGCVENLMFDRQCESGRAPYLMRLVEAAGLEAQALAAVLEALPRSERNGDRDQMVGLLGEYAARGDERAWEVLFRLAGDGNEEAQDALAESGERGLLWAVENVLPGLDEDDRWRIGSWLPDDEADDRTDAQRRLRAVEKADEARLEASRKPSPPREVSPRVFLDGLGAKVVHLVDAVAFAQKASETELLEAAERLLDAREARTQRVLARVFWTRAFPLPIERLFALVDDADKAPRIVPLLGHIDAPAVREFALERMRRRPPDWHATEMLRASFRPGDEAAVRAILPDLEHEDRDVRHGVVLDMIEMMFKQEGGGWQPFAEWVYAHSPCSFCRASAVRRMAEWGPIPPWIREEGAYDSEPEVRALCGV